MPPVTGSFQGFFHSTASGTGFPNQDFALSVRSHRSEYGNQQRYRYRYARIPGSGQLVERLSLPHNCIGKRTISGNTVLLQIYGTNGADVGQIGQTPGSNGSAPTSPVTLDRAPGGFMLHNTGGSGYTVTTKPCPFTDSGNLCLAFQAPMRATNRSRLCLSS